MDDQKADRSRPGRQFGKIVFGTDGTMDVQPNERANELAKQVARRPDVGSVAELSEAQEVLANARAEATRIREQAQADADEIAAFAAGRDEGIREKLAQLDQLPELVQKVEALGAENVALKAENEQLRSGGETAERAAGDEGL